MPVLTFDNVPMEEQAQNAKSRVLTFENVPKESFQEGLGRKYDERMAEIERIRAREQLWQPYTKPAVEGEYRGQGLNPISAAVQKVGQYAGVVNDIVGQEAKYLYNAIPESVKDSAVGRALGGTYRSNLLPGVESLTGVKTSPEAVLGAAGQTVGAGMEALRQYAPDTAANLEAVANIAGAAPVVQGALRGGQVLAKEADIALGRTIRPTAEEIKNLSVTQGYKPIEAQIDAERNAVNTATAEATRQKAVADAALESENTQRAALGLKPKVAPETAVTQPLTFSPDASQRFVNKAKSFALTSDWAKEIGGEPVAAELGRKLDKFSQSGFTLNDAIEVDKQLTSQLSEPRYWSMADRKYTPEGRQLQELKGELRDIMFNPENEKYLVGNKELIDNYKTALKDYRAQAGIDDIQSIISSAEGRPNEASFIRNKIIAIRDNKRLMNSYTPEVQFAIRKAARLGVGKDFLATVGGRATSALIGGAAGSQLGPLGAVIGAGVGVAQGRLARAAALSSQVGSANKIIDAIAAQSSLPTVRQTLTQRIGQNLPGLAQGAESASQMFPEFIKEIMKLKPEEANKILRNLAVVSGANQVVNQQQNNSGAQ